MRSLSTTAKIAIVGATSAALLGTGAAAAWAHNSHQDTGAGRQQAATELATKLGVSEEQLKQAFDKVRSETTEGQRPNREELDQKLADALGIDAATVQQAMQELKENKTSEHRDELSSRLDEAVAAGSITSSDKDAVLKAFDAGVLGGGKGGPDEGGNDNRNPERQEGGRDVEKQN